MRCFCLEFKPYSAHGTLPFSISIPSVIRFLEYMTASTFFALYTQFVFFSQTKTTKHYPQIFQHVFEYVRLPNSQKTA